MEKRYKDENEFNEDKNIQEQLINKFNIISLFGKGTLEDIQLKISRATGLAFVTVDYKGEPITEMTCFTKFCKAIRSRSGNICDCKASDAFGGIQAAVTQQKCVYFCPCGLLEIAIPIIVRGHYLGAFIGGQVRCVDAPPTINRLENVLIHSKKLKNDSEMKKFFELTPLYEYKRFVDVAELVSLIVNQLGEKEAYRLVQNNSLNSELNQLKIDNEKLSIENKLKEIDIVNIKSELNPYFLVNILNSMSNLATIEDSPKTNEMIILFSEFLRESLCEEKKYINLYDEFRILEKYLKIQKIKYGELFRFSINLEQSMYNQKIPTNIILPFVEYAIFYGIGTTSQMESIEVNSYYEDDNVVITVRDNGLGLNKDILNDRFKMFKGKYEGEYIQISIENARHKLITLFGKRYDAVIKNIENEGTESIIKYPRSFEERNV
ncbi:MAG: PocR ligand-binding domain-containing protein [Clostridium sp.]|nr:PocR ligand-binding domain-containing protein [Clostridium sp.]